MDEKETKIININDYTKTEETSYVSKFSVPYNSPQHQTNPIMKKRLVISIKDNNKRFSISDLFS